LLMASSSHYRRHPELVSPDGDFVSGSYFLRRRKMPKQVRHDENWRTGIMQLPSVAIQNVSTTAYEFIFVFATPQD
jgi:hypothetical protein